MRVFGYGAKMKGASMQPVQFDREPLRENDVVIEITHCGVCHTDWHMVRDDFHNSLWPIVPGHEITGTITEIGASVDNVSIGDRVGVGCMINSCLACEACQSGNEQYCSGPVGATFTYNGSKVPTGKNTYGGYSTAIVVRQEFVLRIPDELSNAEAAPLLCAGVTTYRPMKYFGLQAGQTVGIAGFGGLGHIATQIAKALGAKVIVLTTHPEKAIDAVNFGADRVVSMNDEKELKSLANSLDLLISTVPYPYSSEPYLNLLKPTATFALVGNLIGLKEFPTANMVYNGVSIRASLIGGLADTAFVLDLCAKHQIRPQIELIEIQDIQRAFERTEEAEVRYRHVIDLQSFRSRLSELGAAPLLPQEARNPTLKKTPS